MADIVGLIASVLQLIDAVEKVRKYSVGFRDAPKDQEKLLLEIQNLKPLMTELDLRINSGQSIGLPQSLRRLDEQLVPLEEMMQRLKTKLDSGGISKVSARVSWALWGKEDVHEGLNAIERFKSSLSVWLGMDNWKSTRDITTFLQNIVDETRTNHEDVISTVEEATEEQRVNHKYISKSIRDLARSQGRHYAGAERSKVIEWYSPLNFFPRQADVLGTRHPGTGDWLLRQQQFEAWESQPGKILWCPGKPGAGKTVLVSIVVDHLRGIQISDNIGVAVIYLNHKDTEAQSPQNLLAGLWRQLVWQKSIPSTVYQLYEKHRELGTRPSLEEIRADLSSMISEYSQVFVIVDALDEYPEVQCGILLENLLGLGPAVNLMLTSRPHIDVAGFSSPDSLEIRASENDIRQYVQAQIAQSPRLDDHIRKRPDLLAEIETRVISGSEGMFLLAKLRVDSLATKLTIKAVREALTNMPKSLDRAYDEIMARIKSQDEDRAQVARSALLWISNAKRPLHVSELIEALAVEIGTTDMDPDNLLDIRTILSVCAGLVIVEANNELVRLIHFTTQNYLDSIQAKEFPDAATEITQACITYILFDRHKQLSPYVLSLALPETPVLLRYAVTYSLIHARGQPEDSATDLILAFLAKSPGWLPFWNDIHPISRQIPASAGRLYIAAFFDLRGIARYLMANGGVDSAALYAASVNGHTTMVSFLVENGAKVNALGGYHGTALQGATLNGDEEMVRLLIKNGANVNAQQTRSNSALYEASRRGYQVIVGLLIQHGADVNLKSWRGTPLQVVSYQGNYQVARLLVDNGACPDGNVFKSAMSGGHRDIISLLLEKGATAFSHSPLFNGLDVVDRLLKYGAANSPALYSAASIGDIEVICLLFNSAETQSNIIALHLAADNGHLEIVRHFIENGVDITLDADDHNFNATARNGDHETVRLLLEYGADVNLYADDNNHLLHNAARNGHFGLVHVLLEYVEDNGPALHLAATKGFVEIVRLLLEYGTDINAEAPYSVVALEAALYTAARNGQLEVVRLLLNCFREGSPEALKIDGHFPALHQAVSNQHIEVVRLLSEFLGQGGYQPCCISRTWDQYLAFFSG
ncbi:Ankyrin repeat domain containing protein [Mycena venus]|uniref:Ankyrin repeat domain containing protein n=1 Tax=Mycena venus TaxID=2733690 RepID=A0A8H7CH36_9AGAR|nr:Ankyrin repeat domain containing protein [Mycena venus]